MRLPSLKLFLAFFFFSCYIFVSAQYAIPEKPKVLYPVYDEVNLLTDSEKTELNQKLIKFSDSTSTQIEVIIIPTTNGEDVNFVAWQFGEKWGLRNKDAKNGIVFLIAKDDRKMAIQQGRDVEQYITASVAGQILDYLVTPAFKNEQWHIGIDKGTEAIMEAVKGKFKPIAKTQNNDGKISLSQIILIAFIIFIILSFIIKNNNGGGGNFGDDDDEMLSRRGRRTYPGGFFLPGSFGGGGFGGGSSGGGGGFGGFGGGGSGGFGGGGASGGW